MSKGGWKKIVNDKVKDKECKEWTTTGLLYTGLNDFKFTCINLGCPWWVVAKWDYSLLWKIKVMWKLLVTHNIKSGYNCDSFSTPNVGHVLFECPIIETNKENNSCKM